MTPDDKERTSLGSYRMVGAFTGGMVVQGALLFLVAHFGNIYPTINVQKLDVKKYEVTVSTHEYIKNVNIKTKDGIALFTWADAVKDSANVPTQGKSFSMVADEDYSEFKNGRRATGLVYSAGSFATKFGGGIAGVIIGFVLAAFHYNGQDEVSIQGAVPGIIMLMSWIPTIVAVITAAVMALYPLDQNKMDAITLELNSRRARELA